MSNGTATCVICSAVAESCWVKSGILTTAADPAAISSFGRCLRTLARFIPDVFRGGGDGFGYPDYDRDKQAMAPTFTAYLDRIARISGRTGTLLDVGAATGFFMGMARARGWSVSGVEVSDHASQTARSRGFDVRTGVLTGQDFEDSSFDAITMWDVLEHMEDPARDVTKSAALLKKGGVLAINTPDSGSLVRRWPA